MLLEANPPPGYELFGEVGTAQGGQARSVAGVLHTPGRGGGQPQRAGGLLDSVRTKSIVVPLCYWRVK